ncbi:MAG: hypothetical protein SF066_03675 [Thermoanaerobaculia bacterium]|nr:hypothetical protein [Thermoanaerobaculia bacterium]
MRPIGFSSKAAFAAASTLLVAGGLVLAQGIPRSDRVLQVELTLKRTGSRPALVAQVETREGTLVTVQDQSVQPAKMVGLQVAFPGPDSFTPLILNIQNENHYEVDEDSGFVIEESSLQGSRKQGDVQLFADSSVFTIGSRIKLDSVELLDTIGTSGSFEGNFPYHPVVDPRESRPADLRRLFGRAGGGICCVACGSITICATSVTMSCGSCESAQY